MWIHRFNPVAKKSQDEFLQELPQYLGKCVRTTKPKKGHIRGDLDSIFGLFVLERERSSTNRKSPFVTEIFSLKIVRIFYILLSFSFLINFYIYFDVISCESTWIDGNI